ncbi:MULTISPECIES: zinc-dependent alcohol dehydrogenase [Rhodococcus]|uniref:zinc-dependent alcohol dehydrogenase n=1 Tax=Rhodococcus TaxID=1827 RepID=UPI00146B19D6|nr:MULTISPECIES: zinc-binding dehydrogenase [Rhodococcus]MDI9935283.1 zinc-binding dehydrogenase [Rhodococcus sp. IEGM 1351]MDJ0414317.1 zinc-binding dehydrogenase [Rhodococcus opacus]WKN57531.1 zinc-binding dehydrogenase [Rhodococcus opacus]
MASTARAAVLESPRNFEFREFPVPEATADDAVVRVEASGLCGTDYEQYVGGLSFGQGMPIVPGHEIIGRIDSIGDSARARWGVEVGDRITVEPIIPCGVCSGCIEGAFTRCQSGLGYGMYQNVNTAPALWGGYATHVYLHPRALIHKLPNDIPSDIMTLVNPLSNAIRWVYEVGGVGLGSTVVIAGPGQRGLLAVAAAKKAGAKEIVVTGTSADEGRLAIAQHLGATAVVDVEKEDPVARVRELTENRMADIVLDVSAGAMAPILQGIDMLRAGGRLVLAGLKSGGLLNDVPIDKIVLSEIELKGVVSGGYRSTELAIEIITESADTLAPLCTHNFRLEDVADAVRTLGREIGDGRDAVHITLTVD